MSSGIDAQAVYRRVQRAISYALTAVMIEFQDAADTAYAGTRFAGTFEIQPAPILRTAGLVNAAPLLHVVEYPTAPHPIVARTAPELVFYWPKIGGVFRGRAVHHPGTRGKLRIDPLHHAASARFGVLLGRYLDELGRA
jgi:hypothetical protein